MKNSKVIFGMSSVPVPMELYRFFNNINKAIIVQQIHYWCEVSKEKDMTYKFHDGHFWMYNTFEELGEQIPVSVSTIKRLVKELIKDGFIVVANYNKHGYDRTNWYRIDYAKLENAIKSSNINKVSNDTMHSIKSDDEKCQIEPTIPKNITNNISKNKNNNIYTTLSSGGHFFYIYSIVYQRYKNQSHPDVTQKLLDTLRYNLDTTIERLDVVEEDLSELIEYHFQNLSKNNNGHIQALLSNATDSPLYRYYNEIYNC